MGIIIQLDEHLSNQIAAGEVVERPASVLKELIENAVDAGARHVDITAEEGGLSLIRVVDDGAGIQPDDLLVAFQRHATSKIASGRDLFQISTLGFRGEALPSIASVAKVRCLSASESGGLGRLLEIEGGTVKRHEDAASPRGTDMSVSELFYNTPARLKYMRTIQTELSHLSDVVYRQALARPDVAFTFSHNGSVLLRTPGNGDLRQVVAAIYGSGPAKAMLEVQADGPDFSLSGLTAMPIETRASRSAVTVIVNGRFVRSPAVVQPLLQAYHTLLPINRYPLSVLHLRMHPSLLDVNVHPAKLEVRFSKETELRAFVEAAVKEALQSYAYIPSGTAVRKPKPETWQQEQIRFQLPPVDAESVSTSESETVSKPDDRQPEGDQATAERPEPDSNGEVVAAEPTAPPARSWDRRSVGSSASPKDKDSIMPAYGERKRDNAPDQSSYAASSVVQSPGVRQESVRETRPSGDGYTAHARDPWSDRGRGKEPGKLSDQVWRAAFGAPSAETKPEFPELYWIGQLHGTYIVAQNDSGLYLIDQHAAHERIHYEIYYEKFGDPAAASQELLLPVTLSFAPDEYAAIRGKLPWFELAGVYLEDFGGNTFIVRAVPHWLPEGDESDIVREMAEWILKERGIDLHKIREKAAILCSCKASIKANQALSREAGETLLRRLAACKQPYTCPHGRPIVVSFTTYELEKMFKRVMS
ncbi:DNA mismatch repair endonuclease MutL [Cohnella hashimotonis]|uniref:DNA mismatch repair protein MutL n=1 Tax=Cohnella hashimotonis TaxID=2826895 RepID=A0ABT6TH25_9BACL|nr:DNA mismatch repair endonuclease MutL [Cohnella hashimotonis]MDI4645610.1 DNA mismatch repair endonuclease MutL [Cohnella hashimotonis]